MYQNPYFQFRQPALKMRHLRKALHCTKNYSFCSSASNWIGMNSPIFIRHATEPLSLAPAWDKVSLAPAQVVSGIAAPSSEGEKLFHALAILNLDESVDHNSDLDIAFKDNFRARNTSRESISPNTH